MQGIKFKTNKQQFDFKKSLSKLFDYKRDCCSRLRALKSICDAKDLKEVKETFRKNYSIIYSVFHETFIMLDSAKFSSHKKNTTDDDRLLFYIWEKILILLPEFLEKRWQMNSLIFLFKKCLHPSNLLQIRFEAMRLFIIYYQILGETNIRANQQIEILYASIIPGIVTDMGFIHHNLSEFSADPNVKFSNVRPYPIEPFTLNMDQSLSSLNSVVSGMSTMSSNANNFPHYETKYYIKKIFTEQLLEYSITQCCKIFWNDPRHRYRRNFEFLFNSFARIYLPYIFPRLAVKNPVEKEWNDYTIRPLISVYHPPNELPKLRKLKDHCANVNEYKNEHVPFLQAVVIQWFAKYLLGKDGLINEKQQQNSTLTPQTDSQSLSKFSSSSQSNLSIGNSNYNSILPASTSSMSLFSQFGSQQSKTSLNSTTISPTFELESKIFLSWLDSKRFNVDLVLNLFHQAFLWPFSEDLSATMRDVIKVFRQWIFKEPEPLPLFLTEPNVSQNSGANSNPQSPVNVPIFSNNNEDVRAGYMNMLNIFILSSSNVFLLEISPQLAATLEKQIEVSKRILNIYRYMVMKVDMERIVWENLVQVLIRVTECIISPQLPTKLEDTLGGRLAPPFFQTLVVTWIKANLNIPVSNQLWEQFHNLLSSLTNWEEMITEWKNTMFILTRVMSRYVFQINLSELPMDKTISDRKKELRNKPKLHHIRSVSSTAQQQDKNQVTVSSQTANHHNHPNQINHHDQVSRTSSNPDSVRSDSKIHRLTSNDSSSETNGSAIWKNARKVNSYRKSTPYIHLISVNLHKNYHQKNRPLNRKLKRSFSDSCLVLTIEKSLCPIKNNGRFFKRRSYSSTNTKKNSTSMKDSNRTSTTAGNLPMIDDEVDEEETITLADSVDYPQDIDGIGWSVGDLSDHDDASSLNEYLMIDCLRKRILFNSTIDLHIVCDRNNFNNGINNDYPYNYHNNNHLHHNGNCSDSLAETLSLGASAPECNSLKETPLTFDSTSAASTCSSSITEQQMSIGSSETGSILSKHTIDTNPMAAKPVILGGQMKGWNPEAAAILWRRMLEILGDINNIKRPNLHQKAFECLAQITEDFTKIRDHITFLNASSLDNNAQLLVPSLHYYTSWLFRATTLPHEYNAGRLVAYKLLCTIAMYRSEQELSKEFLILFYLALKRAILTKNEDLINTVIKYCGSKFFSASLYGSSCLLSHFVNAANIVINENKVDLNTEKNSRTESLQLLGSLIGFFDVFSNVQCLKSTESLDLEPYTDLKNNVIEILISASKRELNGLGRVISMCSLAIFVYREFMKQSDFHQIKEIINILVAGTRNWVKRPKSTVSPTRSTPNTTNKTSNAGINKHNSENPKFSNRILCRIACDMLRLLADHAQYLLAKKPDFATRIIEGLCYTLELHIDILKRQILLKDIKNLLLCIMFCLSHWCMAVDKEFLLNTLVSENYPGKFVNRKTTQEQQQQQKPKKSWPPCLLDLVISLYMALVNIDPGELVRNQFKDSQYEEIVNGTSVGDMDTIDYTLQMNEDEPRRQLIDQQFDGASTIKKAAHLILLHFLNFMGHFPLPKLRTASLSALINENDDNPYVAANQTDKVDYESLNAPNVLVFTVNDICLMSFVELPLETFESNIWSKLSTSSLSGAFNMLPAKPIRIIIRNVLGKFSWDCMMLASPLIPEKSILSRPMSSLANDSIKSNSPDIHNDEDDDEDEKAMNSFKNSLIKDSLELLVNSIHEAAPECRAKSNNHNPDFLQQLNQLPEAVDTVALLINQHYQECQFIEDPSFNNRQFRASPDRPSPDRDSSISETKSSSNDDSSSSDLLDPVKAFQYCRQMIEQFGFLSWEKRKQIELLSKSQSTVRELRHLDSQQCRDKHKIAVIYVGPGQETRESILLNKSGSRAFEEFVARLGWEVNLANHAGFMGGLQSNLSTGLTAPYYADSFNEVIFHVSTRLEPVTNIGGNQIDPNGSSSFSSQTSIDKQQLMNMKMRHLGNDEIHIVWSEHYKEYRKKILATEFGDVLIVIYPLPANTYPNLFRIQLMRKSEVPVFGPLFHGAVVHKDELPGLVRATAINASRGKRLNMDNYKPYFEERYDSIRKLATKYKEPSTFEEFASRIYAPRYDLLQSKQLDPTSDLGSLMESGFITLEDFVQSTTPSESNPLTPHSLIEPNSPASSTISVSEISFNQQPPSPAIVTPPIMDPIRPSSIATATTTITSTASSLRGLRPSSRSSVK